MEVQAFLDMVADVHEKTSREAIGLQERADALELEIGRFRNLERTLQDTLVAAQQAAEDTRENAKKEGDLIVKEAEIVAERAIEQARGQVSRIRAEIATLKTQRDTFFVRFKGLLEGQTELLKDVHFDEVREGMADWSSKSKPGEEPAPSEQGTDSPRTSQAGE